MKAKAVEEIIGKLEEERIRYLVAGGMAVVAHGYLRFTADLDIIFHLEEENLKKAMGVLKDLNFKPRAPVPIESFSNKIEREKWVNEKNLKVFSLWSKDFPGTEIDVFVEDQGDFKAMYQRGVDFSLNEQISMKVLGGSDLIKMKKVAGRKKDLDDIENLERIFKLRENEK